MIRPKPTSRTFNRLAGAATALVALAAIGLSLWMLGADTRPLDIRHTQAQGVPLTVFAPPGAESAPVAVIGHGFAGSRQMMQPLAITLARHGYLAVTFDFPGHGGNARPFVPDLSDETERRARLRRALDAAVAHARNLPQAGAGLALLGHSMAGDILLDYAGDHPRQVAASVLVSPYISEDTRLEGLSNLLFVFGELEPAALRRPALAAFPVAPEAVRPGVTYGDPRQGDARRLAVAPDVEHIGVLYAGAMQEEALSWLQAALPVSAPAQTAGHVTHWGPWLGLLFGGILLLARPLSALLPRVASPPAGAGLPWRRLLPLAGIPALLTPLLLWPVPLGGLPLLLSDYLALHFAVYGAITWLLLMAWQRRTGTVFPYRGPRRNGGRLLVAALAAGLYAIFAFGLPIHVFVTGYLPGAERLAVMPLILAGTLLFFTADAWLTRGAGAAPWGYAGTKVLLLISLMVAVALRLEDLFFLVIILPAMAVFLLVYGLIDRWTWRATGHPLAGAFAVALALAWGMGVTFPLVSG
ncbi:Serine aminopeptidase, S33 [Ectothiorhodospira mobilis]|uniref:Serine aminopeptidase, S33 n=1 Tax=Ectothiorhodospira mobilis TaxID=195064 RepID=A0A1I4QJD3_ECTMO|nr:alpha/beta fold hydrolase [Ectothiorhodospira mobilis]SFM40171.1 Serine aminopeptidase, S33 [Ectothiorhodospira mobilis]